MRNPVLAKEQSTAMVQGLIGQLSATRESNIRLLSETAGDGNALHALNVTVISLLLGRALQFDEATLADVGVGGLLHDIGKLHLPDRLRWHNDKFSAVEERTFREHVMFGAQMAEKMGLSEGAKAVILQHHEAADGKGYPSGVGAAGMSPAARVVALVNAYDNLCNPGNSALASTPHEALAMMFAQIKPRFDPVCLTAFIRMMGVYPPGSIVQLSDERFALVVSVNASRPLRPHVVVHDAKIPVDEALMLDLQSEPSLGIRRSLHPRHLSRPVLEYLSPRKRMCYFFERSSESRDIVWLDSTDGTVASGGA
jgi:putative nucleotidyltransferase with HDIG domain